MKADGFILVATLWVLAGLALLGAYVDSVVSANLEQAIRIRNAVDEDLDRRSTEATLLYLLASNRTSHRGLLLEQEQRFADFSSNELPLVGDGELWADGSAYQGLGGWRFSMQDEFGLVPVNEPRTRPFDALLKRAGVNAPNRARLIARTLDYVDLDSVLTLNGAEHWAYRRRRLPPPPNWIMATPAEIRRVIGFDEILDARQWRLLKPLLTVRPPAGYNFNTMPLEVAAAVLEVEDGVAARLLQVRRERPVLGLRQVREITGTVTFRIDKDEVLLRPSRFLRLAFWRPEQGRRLLIGVALTPFAEDAPWRKDYRYWEQVPEQDQTTPARPAAALLQQP